VSEKYIDLAAEILGASLLTVTERDGLSPNPERHQGRLGRSELRPTISRGVRDNLHRAASASTRRIAAYAARAM
jgi:hypothetical protein